MKRWFLLLSLCFATPVFSKELPGVNFFLDMLGKDTVTVFDNLRNIGFREARVDSNLICRGDLRAAEPGKFYCARFVNDTSTLDMCIHRGRGVGSISIDFGTFSLIYLRKAASVLEGAKFISNATGADGHTVFSRGTTSCTIVMTEEKIYSIGFSDDIVLRGKQLPGVDFFLRMLGKDTAAVFDSLRMCGFRQLETNPNDPCCGDLVFHEPGQFFCASFAGDSVSVTMCIHNTRGIGSMTIAFDVERPAYFKSAEEYLILGATFLRSSNGVSGIKSFFKGTISCELWSKPRQKIFLISFRNEAILRMKQ